MKKLLFLIFIIIIILNNATADIGETCKEAFKKDATKAIEWLKNKGIWDPVVGAYKQGGKELANKICEKIFLKECCPALINFIDKYYN